MPLDPLEIAQLPRASAGQRVNQDEYGHRHSYVDDNRLQAHCWYPSNAQAYHAQEEVGALALKTMKPRLQRMEQRLKAPRQVRDTRYSPDATVRGWYKSARWQALRQQVLVRDLYTCQRTGMMLVGKAPAPNSPVVHHKIPHHGDEHLFWDINNLQAVSKAWHDSDAQAEERNAPDPGWRFA